MPVKDKERRRLIIFRYNHSEKNKANQKRWRQSLKGKASKSIYNKSAKGRAAYKRWRENPENRESELWKNRSLRKKWKIQAMASSLVR